MRKLPAEISALLPSEEAYAALLGELVKLPSASGKEEAVQRFMRDWLVARGIQAELRPAGEGMLNLVAAVTADEPGPALLFFGHADTALPVQGWETDPFMPTVKDGRLYGLGAMDMKAGLATAMLTLEILAKAKHLWRGSILFAAVADEEAYSQGARALLADGIQADAAILCEPHFDHATIGGVGKVLVRVEVEGKSAHGSHPHLGINAVVEAGRLLAVLDQLPMGSHPQVGDGSQCVLGIRGGPDAYVIQVPESCSFTINRHIVPGETAETVVAQMEEQVAALNSPARFRITVDPPYYPPYAVPEDHPFVRLMQSAYQTATSQELPLRYGRGVSDGNYMVADASIPTVMFGPSGRNLHAANEWADLTQMPVALQTYLHAALAFLAR